MSNNNQIVSNNLNGYGLYDLEELNYKESEIRQNYNQILKPLALFAPYIYEDATFKSFKNKIVKDESDLYAKVELLFDEEVLPINDYILEEPSTVEKFIELINERLRVRNLDYLTKVDQEDMIKVVVQEAKFKWKEMKRLIEDPSLTEMENAELRRRVFVNVISICEKVYNFYILKANILKSRNIFNDTANFSRLITLMASDVRKFLNIHSLKHYLIMNMKAFKRTNRTCLNDNVKITHKLKKFTLQDLIEDFRLKYEIKSLRKYKNKRDHLKEIYNSMPVLETKNLEKILNTARNNRRFLTQTPTDLTENILPQDDLSTKAYEPINEDVLISNLTSNEFIRPHKKRSKSINVLTYPKLAAELNIDLAELSMEKYKTTDVIKFTYIHGLQVRVENEKNNSLKIADLSHCDAKTVAKKLKEDLKLLGEQGRFKQKIEDKNDDALLMTLTSKPNHKEYMMSLQTKINAIDERYQNFLEEIKLPIHDEYEHPQPATFEFNFYNNFPIRLSDIRVSTRILRYNMTLKPFSPLYNNISGEINSDMVQHLDRNLQIGGEVKEVYDELVKTISDDHLRFDIDDFVHKAPLQLKYKSSYTSATLLKYGITKSVNQDLLVKAKQEPPWNKLNYRDWNKTPLLEPDDDPNTKKVLTQTTFIVPQAINPEKMEQFKHIDPSTLSEKEYKSWYNWWIENYSTQDYLKYLSTQNSDYLSLIFHLYGDNSDKKFIATDQEKELMEAKILAEKEKESMISELEVRKKKFEPGMWNVETVNLGGLGNEPIPDENEDPVLKLKKSLEENKTKIRKIQLFKTENLEEKEEEEAKIRMRQLMTQTVTFSPQNRLERIWNLLRMEDSAKLDMAIKYCTNEYAANLLPAIDEWEKATELIVEREKQLFELENFEKMGSDPNRFFMKGFRGSSAARLGEALYRDNIYKEIDSIQVKLETILITIQKKFKDTIAYNGRNYLEKMKWDRVEMLHSLTEERRMKYFKQEIKARQIKINFAELQSTF